MNKLQNSKYWTQLILSTTLCFTLILTIFPKNVSAFFSTIDIPTSYEDIGSPQDLIMLSDTEIWYADSLNYRIVKINTDGEILRIVGRQGTDEGEFAYPLTSIARDSDGYLHVLTHERVYMFDFNGGYISSWGVLGNGGGAEFSNPKAMHYDEYDGTLLISDTGNDRIARFTLDGTFISDFGTSGTGNGQFDAPQGLTTDEDGNIYVVDVDNHRVQVFTGDGTFIRTFGGTTPGDYYLEFPKDIEVLSNGDIIVTSQNSNLIKKFDSTGIYISEWSASSPQYLTQASDGSLWVSGFDQKKLQHFSNIGSLLGEIKNSGTTDGYFSNPYNYDFDSSGNIYVIDDTSRIQKFNSTGTYVDTLIDGASQIGGSAYNVAVSPASGMIIVSSERAVSVFDEYGVFINNIGEGGIDWVDDGSENGEFNHARDMAFDSNGYLYVLDYFNARVQKFDLSQVNAGDFLTTHNGGFVDSWSVMSNPLNIFIDSADTIYISPREADADVLTVKKYNTTGDDQGTLISKFGPDSDQYWNVSGIYIDESDGDKLYITDSELDKIQVYDSSGNWLETIGGSGSGQDQFDNPTTAAIHPVTGNLVVSDQGNHRLQLFTEGVRIKNLTPSADVIDQDSSLSLVSNTTTPSSDLNGELYFGPYIVSDFEIDLTSDRDWNSVNVIVNPEESKSLVVNLNPTDAPGIGTTHSLYILKLEGQNKVGVCPQADLISEVSEGCSGWYELSVGDSSLSSVTVGGYEYWKVSGLTGTGAYAYSGEESSPASNNGGNSNGSSGSNSTSGSNCSATGLAGTPDLFQINTLGNSATLYFTPLPGTNTYHINYSTNPKADEHGAQVTLSREGVQSFTVNLLNPNTVYYFKVKGLNDCSSSNWSATLNARTTSKNTLRPSVFYKYGPIKSLTAKTSTLVKPAVFTKNTPVPVALEKTQTSTPKTLQETKSTENKKICFLWWCL